MAILNTFTDTITLLDMLSAPVTGATFTVTSFEGPAGDVSTSLVAFTELGAGIYEFTAGPLNDAGFYSLTVQADDDWSQVFTDTWTIAPVYAISAFEMLADTYTLKDARRAVAEYVGDIQVFTATATGTTTTLIDADRITAQPSTFAGRQALVSGGTVANLGQIRTITASSRDLNKITFSRALPAITAIGDEVEVMNAYGIGITFEMVVSAINHALRIARRSALIPVSAIATDPYDGKDTFTIAIPDEFAGVSALQYLDDRDHWKSVNVAGSLGANGWFVDPTTRTITLQGQESWAIKGRQVKLFGFVKPDPVVNDSDLISIDYEWLVNTAASHCLLNIDQSRQTPGDWTSKGLLYKQDAEKLRTRLRPNLPPNYKGL